MNTEEKYLKLKDAFAKVDTGKLKSKYAISMVKNLVPEFISCLVTTLSDEELKSIISDPESNDNIDLLSEEGFYFYSYFILGNK